MISAHLSRNDLPKIARNIAPAMAAADMAAFDYLANEAAPKILELAIEKCPVLWGDMAATGQIDVGVVNRVVLGDMANVVTISFGGGGRKANPPREYVEEQHENSGISHSGSRGGKGRFVYLYLAGRVPRVAPSGRMVGYAQRDLKTNRPKQGQAHWLFGRQNSAFETLRYSISRGMVKHAQDAFRRQLRA